MKFGAVTQGFDLQLPFQIKHCSGGDVSGVEHLWRCYIKTTPYIAVMDAGSASQTNAQIPGKSCNKCFIT